MPGGAEMSDEFRKVILIPIISFVLGDEGLVARISLIINT